MELYRMLDSYRCYEVELWFGGTPHSSLASDIQKPISCRMQKVTSHVVQR